jgi:glycosyltransferase involved in cell wall biosynthesis
VARCLGSQPIAPTIVVDNGSEDATPGVIDRTSHRLPIAHLTEPMTGLSRARNRALAECVTPFIVFLDDDAQVDPGWAGAIRSGLDRWQPDCFGGPYRPFYLTPKPAWFRDDYAAKHLDKQAGPLADEELLSGGNMGWRTDLLHSLGGFPSHLGMTGNRLGIGEESFLQFRIVREQPDRRRVFLPDMTIRHLVSEEKMRVGYWLRRAWLTGWYHDTIRHHRDHIRWTTALRLPLASAAVLLSIPVRNRHRFPFWQNLVLERFAPKLKMMAIIGSRLTKGERR